MPDTGKLLEILASFSSVRAGVVGDVMVDRFIYGDAQRISPEAPVPVVTIRRRATQAGGAANAAANVISLGGRASLFGALGDDPPGHEIRHLLTAQGCDLQGLVTPDGYESTVKTRVVAQSQQLIRIDEEHARPVGDASTAELIAAISAQLEELDVLVISDYAKGVLSAELADQLKGLARRRAIPLVVDPKPVNMPLYSGASVLKPNLGEALRYIGLEPGPGQPEMSEVCARVMDRAGVDAVIVTAGADGVHVLDADGYAHLQGHPRDVYDVAGAGDSTLAAVALALGAGSDLRDAAQLGNLAGSIAVGHLGVVAVGADELRAELEAGHGD